MMMMMPRQPTSYRSAFATLKGAVSLLKLAGGGGAAAPPSSQPVEPERVKVIQLLKAANRRCVRLSELAEQQADQDESDHHEYQLPFHIVAHTAHPDQSLCSLTTNADSSSSCSMIALIQINVHDEQLLWTQQTPTTQEQQHSSSSSSSSSSCSPPRVRDLIVAIVLYNLGVCFLARAEEYQMTTEEDETNDEADTNSRHSQQQQQTKRQRQKQEERSRAAAAAGMRLLASCQDIAATQYADLDDDDDDDNDKNPSSQQPFTTSSSSPSSLLLPRILLFSAIVLQTNQQLWHAWGDLEQAYVCATSLACLRDTMLAQQQEEGMILEEDCAVLGNQPTMFRKTTTATRRMCRQKKVAPAA